MHQPRRLRLTASIILWFVLQAQGADKYTDENRPYEFGFKIDGQQHRHESKDKDGIVMGEFGFVTADDVYHVTVYATDKEGRFKILSMKNIHLKASTASSLGPPTSPRQGHALALPPASVQIATLPKAAPVPQGIPVTQLKTPFKPISIEPPGRACSSCSLPTTTTRAPPPIYNPATDNNNFNSPNQFGAPVSGSQNQQTFPPATPGQGTAAVGGFNGAPYSPQGGQQNYPPGQQNYPTGQQNYPTGQQNYPSVQQNYPTGVQLNIPQKELVAPDGGQTFAPQPSQTAQNYPGSPNNSGGSSAPNVPTNYAQPGEEQNRGGNAQQPGLLQTTSGEQNPLFGGDNIPYSGVGPSGSVPDAGNFRQDNAESTGLFGPQSTGQASYPQAESGERTPKQYNGPGPQIDTRLGSQGPSIAAGGQRGPAKPTLISAQMQIVDKDTDIHALGPGEQRGLPPGLTQDHVSQLLYTFNYTVGFHGHFEEGYTDGVKKGYYFVTGRNGVRTRIDYVADDTGFHPKVSQEVLDLLSEDVPKPETEKDEKYGLKGYEFKWLYYPVEPKKR